MKIVKSASRGNLQLGLRFMSSSIPHQRPDAPSFPCVDANESRAAKLATQANKLTFIKQNNQNQVKIEDVEGEGPEPVYATPTPATYQSFTSHYPLLLDYGGVLPNFDIAYETWGSLNQDKSNAILLHTGLSASSHAKSHPGNDTPGWWERFIGPGSDYAIDTEKFFVICTNVLGGCYGSTGPSSPHPEDSKPYGTRFPIITQFDMVRAQWRLIDSLGIHKLYASAGCSMGGMQSIAAAHLEPERVRSIISISGTARSGSTAVAMRFAQRSCLMSDPNWNRGFYYDGMPPHTGMKMARQIATITYRSGPEWEQRFGRKRRVTPLSDDEMATNVNNPGDAPKLCPDFLIETYLDHQGEQFCLKYDANSLIYVSKAMDLFDMTKPALMDIDQHRKRNENKVNKELLGSKTSHSMEPPSFDSVQVNNRKPYISTAPAVPYAQELTEGLTRLSKIPVLIIGVHSDILFPFDQQRELADSLRKGGDPERVKFFALDGPWGHDTFLIDTSNVGGAIRGFLI
ncbi:hypothetical protein E3P86_03270 [Wallemia ichthyophaga]|uniref:AB hydrolase-1 domain-containing protein n=1 Tax=Wallemia ichthyophaga TaxID=245174 RepID=A0A4T0IPG5_WALIC|nr:hypothetical protein E3P86_03270 [Wallemia ichthyophaga]